MSAGPQDISAEGRLNRTLKEYLDSVFRKISPIKHVGLSH